jgi:hypothetical protein
MSWSVHKASQPWRLRETEHHWRSEWRFHSTESPTREATQMAGAAGDCCHSAVGHLGPRPSWPEGSRKPRWLLTSQMGQIPIWVQAQPQRSKGWEESSVLEDCTPGLQEAASATTASVWLTHHHSTPLHITVRPNPMSFCFPFPWDYVSYFYECCHCEFYGVSLKLWISFTNVPIFTALILPIQEHWEPCQFILSL